MIIIRFAKCISEVFFFVIEIIIFYKKNMSCNSCNQKAEFKLRWSMILSLEILITSIYGHIYLFDKLIPLLKSFF